MRNFGKITGHHPRPQFHLSLLGALALLGTWRHLAATVGTSKGRGMQWQTTPKTCPECSMPEPYRSPDWTLVPAETGPRLNTNTNNNNTVRTTCPNINPQPTELNPICN
jgi:hypothetical protein